jgi:starvation-inducible DNA-binding protein
MRFTACGAVPPTDRYRFSKTQPALVRRSASPLDERFGESSGLNFPATASIFPVWHPKQLKTASNSRTETRSEPVFSILDCLKFATAGEFMAKKPVSTNSHKASAQPRYHQSARELQAFGTVTSTQPLQLDEPVRLEMTEQLNQLLADTMTLRDLYKKSHWQVSGATFYQLHLLFDKHYEEQSEIVDTIAERIQLLGGISIAMAADVAETTRIPRPPKGREEVPVQLSRLLDAHELIVTYCRELAERADKLGDAGTNDMVVSDVLRTNELQIWFVSEHLVDAPLVEAEPIGKSA